MAKVRVYGSSDDLIEVEGIEGEDEFNETKGGWVGVLESLDGDTALLYVDYRKNGTWTVTLGLWEDDYILPAWPIRLYSDKAVNGYSVVAEITVPDGTTVSEYKE
jgi:hypothetical protein